MSCACCTSNPKSHGNRSKKEYCPKTSIARWQKYVGIRKRPGRYPHFVRAYGDEMHMDISQGNFCASQRAQNERPTTSTLNERGLYPYRKTFQSGHTVCGILDQTLTQTLNEPYMNPYEPETNQNKTYKPTLKQIEIPPKHTSEIRLKPTPNKLLNLKPTRRFFC